MPRFLSVADVLQLHDDTILTEGGAIGLRDLALLDSAVAMPMQQIGSGYLHDDLAAQAAAYLFHIAKNHAFVDGNKRTAVLSALVFLRANSVERLPDPTALESITLGVVENAVSKEQLTDWFREHTD